MKPPERIGTTDAEIDALSKLANEDKNPTRILAAHFDQPSDAIVVRLSTKATIIVPRTAVPGWGSVDPRKLADLAAQSSGFSIWSEKADTGVRIERLVQLATGTALATAAASILGQKSTPAKAAAARVNGRIGGRPRKAAAL